MIYLVEDDQNIRELVVYTLNNSGMITEGFAEAREFRQAICRDLPDLILLDIMLPEVDGMTLLKEIRQNQLTKKTPVILVTAKNSEYDKVIGLDNGADDYITKPFGMMELIARIKALLRRTGGEASIQLDYKIGSMTVSPTKHTVLIDGKEVSLTYKEFELLRLLLENRNMVMTRDRLLTEIWGYSFDGESRTVDVHIRTLRQKLGENSNYIETVRGIGYKIGKLK